MIFARNPWASCVLPQSVFHHVEGLLVHDRGNPLLVSHIVEGVDSDILLVLENVEHAPCADGLSVGSKDSCPLVFLGDVRNGVALLSVEVEDLPHDLCPILVDGEFLIRFWV